MITDQVEAVYGTVIGADHLRTGKLLVGKNNQDAIACASDDTTLVAAICDGCGSGKHSEVGSKIAANFMVQAVLERKRVGWSPPSGIWTIGDGAYYHDWLLETIGPFPGNAPPYMAYDLVDSAIVPELLKFQQVVSGHEQTGLSSRPFMEFVRKGTLAHIHVLASQLGNSYSRTINDYFLFTTVLLIVNIGDLDWLPVLIGSDGLQDIESHQDRYLPGKSKILGGVSQFLTNDQYFQNPDAASRLLRLANSECTQYDAVTKRLVVHPGLLPDDTTFFGVRRKEVEPCPT